ncbi:MULTISPECIES: dTMP kinase [Pseudomonas]|uniref:dTMP kinase n=1 Tax=Pseudomonas TaxID=286 RepID=UPI000CFA9233|nr:MULTISPECIES: dTMP kinase [Pseudomonas]PQZ93194.1 thymidylate kinase [Pseudomonas trivialis]PRB28515.1 thymidylate kinase [Pseudomonas sp. MYb60]
MNRPLFISFDGPKGTGKTTLLEAVTAALRAGNQKVVRLCERKSDPNRGETMALVNELARNPSSELEWVVCQRFAKSRRWISQHVLTRQPQDSMILIDRWYPSDAAFRHEIPFAEILQLNRDRGVQTPDLHVGVITEPAISWARAANRSRGLGGTVIQKYAEHVVCSEMFEQAAADQGWVVCRNEGAVEDAVMQVVSEIGKVSR